MSPSLLFPNDPPTPGSDADRRVSYAGDRRGHDDPPSSPGRARGRMRLAALLAVTALLGGGASAGILAATGALGGDGGATTTVIERTASLAARNSSSSGLDAEALYASASAGVVDISVTGTSSAQGATPFGGGGAPQSQTSATGTGFVVDGKGHILTAAHVVDGASSITVKLQDGTTRTATVLGKDDATDVAVIKIDPSGLKLHPLALGSSASLNVGEGVAIIGDPFGYQRSLSTGIVSGVDRTIQAPNGFTVAHAIQTDAAMNPGNSGGPVLDASGQVIGIVDQIATNGSSDQSSGVGFAVPIDLVRSVLSKLEGGQRVSHAYLGVATGDSSTTASGATISGVTSGGPGAGAGLRTGDVVTGFAGTRIAGSNDLVAAIAAHQPGDRVAVEVRRGSRTLKLSATLGIQPAQGGSSG